MHLQTARCLGRIATYSQAFYRRSRLAGAHGKIYRDGHRCPALALSHVRGRVGSTNISSWQGHVATVRECSHCSARMSWRMCREVESSNWYVCGNCRTHFCWQCGVPRWGKFGWSADSSAHEPTRASITGIVKAQSHFVFIGDWKKKNWQKNSKCNCAFTCWSYCNGRPCS
jgi:hypothetical protein